MRAAKKEKTIPTTKKGAHEFVEEKTTTLVDQLIKLCEKLETGVFPVYVHAVSYIKLYNNINNR